MQWTGISLYSRGLLETQEHSSGSEQTNVRNCKSAVDSLKCTGLVCANRIIEATKSYRNGEWHQIGAIKGNPNTF